MPRPILRFCVAILLAAIAQLQPLADASANTITIYSLPPNGGWCICPLMITTGPDGNLWFTENGGDFGNGAIASISTTGGSGSVKTYGLSTYNSGPVGITEDPTTGSAQGLWFTEQDTNKIGFLSTMTYTITEFTLTLSASQPRGIVFRSQDGDLWFTQTLANPSTTTCTHHRCTTTTSNQTGYIGRMTPSGAVTEFQIPNAYSSPLMITVGPDGNLWFTDEGTSSVGMMTPTGSVTEYPLPIGSQPHEITVGPDGNLWATEQEGNQIARITTTSGAITPFSAPGAPAGITATSTALWFTQVGNSSTPAAISEMTTTGSITSFPLSMPSSPNPQGITVGPDGNLWFTEQAGGAVGVITSS
jgi:streptogramin lyase